MIDNSNRNDSEVIMTMIQLVTEIVIMLITIRPSYLISYKKIEISTQCASLWISS